MFITVIYGGRVFGDTTMYFMSLLWKKWPIFSEFSDISRYPEYQNFLPGIIFSPITFSQQLSGINIHDIKENVIFWPYFHQMGPFWVPRFKKKGFKQCLLLFSM